MHNDTTDNPFGFGPTPVGAAAGEAATVDPTATVADPRSRRRRRRRIGGGAVASVLAVAAALYLVPDLREKVPTSMPVIGKNADTVFGQIKDAGLPITDGVPADSEFRDMVKNNVCESSRTFVRSDADMGWGLICVNPPDSAYRRMSNALDGVPMFMGPLYVDDNHGDVIVFGLGWPTNASKQVANAIDANGTYLVEQPGY